MAAGVAELTETSSHDEIQSFVDEITEARAGDPPKTDAEIANGHADNFKTEDTTAAPDKGDETAAATKAEGEEKAEGRDWFDDDLKAEVAAYGVDENELADFTSREEVQRALRFFDKSALEAGRKAMAESEATPKDPTRDEKGRFVPKGETETKPEGKPDGKGGYEIKLDKNVYDEPIVEEFTRLRDHYESRLEKLQSFVETIEARFQEADAKAEEQQFDSLVDSLGHADLFGKTNHENAKQLERRKDLHVQVKAMMNGLASLGRPTEMSDALINRVAKMVFSEEFSKKDLKSRTSKIQKQSNGRMGGGATRPTEPSESARDEAERLYRELVSA